MKSVVLLACAAVAAGMAVPALQPVMQVRSGKVGLEEHETYAAASLVGQFRTNVAAWLWVRTDLYLHNGVELRPMTEAEKSIGVQSAEGRSNGEGVHLDERNLTTAVPAEANDFRGVFGTLERATQAYQIMGGHAHRDPQAALPLFRLMTWADPQFEEGWSVGASVMRNRSVHEADVFLVDGIQANPRSLLLRTDLAELRLVHEKAPRAAVELLKALTRDGEARAHLGEDEAEALQRAFRWEVLGERAIGNPEAARATALRGLRLFHDDAVLARHAFPVPAILSESAAAKWTAEKVAAYLRSMNSR